MSEREEAKKQAIEVAVHNHCRCIFCGDYQTNSRYIFEGIDTFFVWGICEDCQPKANHLNISRRLYEIVSWGKAFNVQ